jgi:hypothetical protein
VVQVLHSWEKGLNVTTMFSPFNATDVIGVQIETFDGSIVVTLSEQCVQTLLFPSQLYAHHPTSIHIIHIYIDYRNSKTKALPGSVSNFGS